MVLRFAEMMRGVHREDRGFTLIELLVVIAILGVLAAIALPLVASRIDQARESANNSNLRLLQGAVELYKLDTGEYPDGTDWQDVLVNDPETFDDGVWQGPYLKAVVVPPTNYSAYEIDANGIVTNNGPGGVNPSPSPTT